MQALWCETINPKSMYKESFRLIRKILPLPASWSMSLRRLDGDLVQRRSWHQADDLAAGPWHYEIRKYCQSTSKVHA